jgi:leucyl/phenylalanyl-tRNA--protein transferase
MFSRRTDASKVALVALLGMLVRRGGRALDCQLMNPHLASLGAQPMARSAFLALLHAERDRELIGDWTIEPADLAPSGAGT